MTDRVTVRTALAAGFATCVLGALIGTGSGIAVQATTGVLVIVGAVSFVRIAASHEWAARAFRNRSVDADVAGTLVRVGPVGGSVFVAGLGRPTIFCDDVLVERLADAELRAVALHERAHQLARDPLRNVAVATVAPVVRRSTRGQAWIERRAAWREIAADRYAVAHGADRRAIAAALLKVPAAGSAHAVRFAPAVELRLRALLGEEVETISQRSWRPVVLGALLLGVGSGALLCLAMLDPAAGLAQLLRVCCLS